jgi:hypothetical protein
MQEYEHVLKYWLKSALNKRSTPADRMTHTCQNRGVSISNQESSLTNDPYGWVTTRRFVDNDRKEKSCSILLSLLVYIPFR